MVEAEFDRISNFYDSTREPATDAEVRAVEGALKGYETVLEVGVGTGRFAKPLMDLGFDVVGIDISRGMMARALQKGVKDLVLADVHHLPFRDGSFDAATAIHVLHVVPDWRNYMREVGRVTKKAVVSLLRERNGIGEGGNWKDQEPSGVQLLYTRLRLEMGYPVDVEGLRRAARRWQNEYEIRNEVPPTRTERIRDEVVTVTLEEALRKRRQLLGVESPVPEKVEKRIIEMIVAERGSQSFERIIVEDLVVWAPQQFTSNDGKSIPM
jgi:ubiquinone/menaquinone biosynthesis C-methylase UbiE